MYNQLGTEASLQSLLTEAIKKELFSLLIKKNAIDFLS